MAIHVSPEDWMDVDSYQLTGEIIKKDAPKEVAQPVDSFEGVQQQLFQAQRDNNQGAITQLAQKLDDMLASVAPTEEPKEEPKVGPASEHSDVSSEASSTPPERSLERPESPSEEPKLSSDDNALIDNFEASETLLELNEAVGSDTVDAVHEWANEHLPEDQLRSYMELVSSGDHNEAVQAFQAIQQASKATDGAPEGTEPEVFDQDTTFNLVDRFGEYGETMIKLNTALTEGEATFEDIAKYVSRDPQLLDAVMQAKAAGLISY